MAFWDSSAVVPLCCSQTATLRGRQLLRDHGQMVVWWGTPVEAQSAFARLQREDQITPSESGHARALLTALRGTWDEVQQSEQVRQLAEQLPQTYALRAADALQLAAALVWCRERPRDRPFICLDRRLGVAAQQVGFEVLGTLERPKTG